MHSSCRRASTAAGRGPDRWASAARPGRARRSSVCWCGGSAPDRSSRAWRRSTRGSLAAATGVAVVTTVCCAWRWMLVARGLGVALPLRSAVAAYYRSQFLNVATTGRGARGRGPGRAARPGRGDTSRGLRSVVWERSAGQVVLVAVAGAAWSSCPRRCDGGARWPDSCAAARWLVGLAGRPSCAGGPLPAPAAGRAPAWARAVRRAGADLRAVRSPGIRGPASSLASVVAVAGHVLTFLVAARTAGSGAAPVQAPPLALVVLLAMGLPERRRVGTA